MLHSCSRRLVLRVATATWAVTASAPLFLSWHLVLPCAADPHCLRDSGQQGQGGGDRRAEGPQGKRGGPLLHCYSCSPCGWVMTNMPLHVVSMYVLLGREQPALQQPACNWVACPHYLVTPTTKCRC